MNIVELILKALSGETLKQLSGAFGESSETVQKALAAIVPTLLSGIGQLATQPQGADKLWSTLRSVDDQAADDFGKVLGEKGVDDVTQKGSIILDELLGKVNVVAILKALGTFLASNPEFLKKLVPLVAPLILSIINKQVKSGGLDLAGLLKLLLAQKGNIAKAMPAGLTQSLAGVQGLGDIASFASSNTALPAETIGKPATSWSTWLVAAVASIGLVAATWHQLYQGVDAEKARTLASMREADEQLKNGTYAFPPKFRPAPTSSNPPGEAIGHGDVKEAVSDAASEGTTVVDPVKDFSNEFAGFFELLSQTLEGISDVDTANQSLPKLEKLNEQLDGIVNQFGKVPDAARSSLLEVVETGHKSISDKVNKLIEIPGVVDVIQSLLKLIQSKFDLLLKN